MKWWSGLSILQRIAFVSLVVCLVGFTGSFIWGYSVRPLILIVCGINLFTFVGYVRSGLKAPVPGRPELSEPTDTHRDDA